MVAQTERLALHLEIPAVPRRALMQIAIRRELPRTRVAAGIGETRAGLVQLRQQRLERLADAHERRDTFFVQLSEDVLVPLGGLVKAHASIVADSRLPFTSARATVVSIQETACA